MTNRLIIGPGHASVVDQIANIPERRYFAEPGNTIWVWDVNKTVYDTDGKYKTRGDWTTMKVTKITRGSVICDRVSFDRETGQQRGNYCTFSCYGYAEKATKEWRDEHIHRLARCVEAFKGDVSVLQKIANMVGYKP